MGAYRSIRATWDDMPTDPRVPMIDAHGPRAREESRR
jgi:hypothetical protein